MQILGRPEQKNCAHNSYAGLGKKDMPTVLDIYHRNKKNKKSQMLRFLKNLKFYREKTENDATHGIPWEQHGEIPWV